jgi:dihydrofolate synthase / folylpolyglutamate synthase
MMLPSELKPFIEKLGGYDRKTIHIAGSKGKGSTTMLLSYLLQLKGKKVGQFISPFISNVRECMQINGEMISESDFVLLESSMSEKLSEFEKRTLIALRYFQENDCDFVVLETGWGGEKDATNLVESKVLTILTHIELEHTKTLGNSIAEITKTKLGISRPNVPLLTPPSKSPQVNKMIQEMGIKPIYTSSIKLAYHHPDAVGLAIEAVKQLGFDINENDHKKLAEFKLPGRFEIQKHGRHTVISDGAHTHDSVTFVQENVERYMKENEIENVHWAIHFLKDKPDSLSKLFPRENTYWVAIEDDRAGLNPERLLVEKLTDIFRELDHFSEPQLLVIVGSFKLVRAFNSFK